MMQLTEPLAVRPPLIVRRPNRPAPRRSMQNLRHPSRPWRQSSSSPASLAPGPEPQDYRSSAFHLHGPAGPCAVSTGDGPAPHRPVVRRPTALAGRARCTRGTARSSVVSPCRLLHDELVQGEIRAHPPEPVILKLQLLQQLCLVQLQACASFLACCDPP